MKEKLISGLKATLIIVLIAAFELKFIAKGTYEVVAEWVRYYSRSITIASVGTLVIVVIIGLYGITYENENGKKRAVPQTIISSLLIIIFVMVKIKNI